MAHKGRLYPLSKYRGVNGDAPFLRGAPRYAEFTIPTATGTLAGEIANRIIRLDEPLFGTAGIFYRGQVVNIPFGREYTIKLQITWNNILPNPRVIAFELSFTQILPPAGGNLFTGAGLYVPTKTLTSAIIPTVTIDAPALFDPNTGQGSFNAIGWHGEPVF